MKQNIAFTLLFLVSSILLLSFNKVGSISVYEGVNESAFSEVGVSDLFVKLGDSTIKNPIIKANEAKAKIGEELILTGISSNKGKKGRRISSYFTCTDCHNLNKEFNSLTEKDPQKRLDYAVENNLPFLPGSTFFGIYNRNSFYNTDYVKKYGDLVNDARNSLEGAVQLCAEYCSSGRELEDWELEGIMHYFKKNELKVKDLNLDKKNFKALKDLKEINSEKKKELLLTLKSMYTQKYDAHFIETKDKSKRSYGKGASAANGEKIYEKSCMYCHDNARVTYLDLDKDVLSARFLWNNRKTYKDQSVYQIVRHGTYAKVGRKQYMPLYTEEKLSRNQEEDLMAYIKQLAGK